MTRPPRGVRPPRPYSSGRPDPPGSVGAPVPDARATASVVGVAVLLAITVVGAAVVGSLALSAASTAAPSTAATTVPTSLAVAVDGDRVAVTHRGGGALDVRDLRIRVVVDGEPLAHQPPVPFFSARGFHPGPRGPFNVAADPTWTAGEVASFRVAGTNAPRPSTGARVTVSIYDGERPVARLTATG